MGHIQFSAENSGKMHEYGPNSKKIQFLLLEVDQNLTNRLFSRKKNNKINYLGYRIKNHKFDHITLCRSYIPWPLMKFLSYSDIIFRKDLEKSLGLVTFYISLLMQHTSITCPIVPHDFLSHW